MKWTIPAKNYTTTIEITDSEWLEFAYSTEFAEHEYDDLIDAIIEIKEERKA